MAFDARRFQGSPFTVHQNAARWRFLECLRAPYWSSEEREHRGKTPAVAALISNPGAGDVVDTLADLAPDEPLEDRLRDMNLAVPWVVEWAERTVAEWACDPIAKKHRRWADRREGWSGPRLRPPDFVDEVIFFRSLAAHPALTIRHETLAAPRQPTALPAGWQGVHTFRHTSAVWLKIGKVGPNSNARWQSQHYNAGRSPSNLAWSRLQYAHRCTGVPPRLPPDRRARLVGINQRGSPRPWCNRWPCGSG